MSKGTKRVPVWLVWSESPAGTLDAWTAFTWESAQVLAKDVRSMCHRFIEITGPHYPKVSA